MFDQFRQLVYSDKIFEHPVLGKVSCGAFADTLKECKAANFRSKGQDLCLELKQVTSKCYGGKDVTEVKAWIDSQFEESLMMMRFLKERKSSLPDKMTRNSWAVFTNSNNLESYQKITNPNP